VAAGIRSGAICGQCRGRCVNAPSTASPLDIACLSCEGAGCEKCNGTGVSDTLTTCPQAYIGDLRELHTAASMLKQGVLPVQGGWLEQSYTFLEAVELLAYYEARLSNGKAVT
jgi:hypothetical protein